MRFTSTRSTEARSRLRQGFDGPGKNDRIDSAKLAHLLRANLIPPSYVYPRGKRPIRALLRQRMRFVRDRAEIFQRIETQQLAEGREPVRRPQGNREPWREALKASEPDVFYRISLEADVMVVEKYDEAIESLEDMLLDTTKELQARDLAILLGVPGIGKVLSMTLLYEIDDIGRFPSDGHFRSYCRLVKGTVASSGKVKGLKGAKLGNAYLRWAFGEAAVLAKRHDARIRAMAEKLEKRHGKHKANTILANRLARAVYYMLKNHTAFDAEAFCAPVLASKR